MVQYKGPWPSWDWGRGVFRNHKGDWVLGFLQPIPHATPFEAELRGLLGGLEKAVNCNLSPLWINTDSLELIQAIKTGNLTYDNLISKCRYLMNRLGTIQMQHVFREQNHVVDSLAKEAVRKLNMGTTTLFVTPPPPFVRQIWQNDSMGTMYIRKINSKFLISLDWGVVIMQTMATGSGCSM